MSSDSSTLCRPAVPWSGNPADRGRLNHVRRADLQPFQTFASAVGGVPLTSTLPLPHPGYVSDSETDGEGPRRLGWVPRGHCRTPACSSGADRRVQDWAANVTRPGLAGDCYTLGARRHRQVYNGVAPAISAPVTADNQPLAAANANRYAAFRPNFGLESVK